LIATGWDKYWGKTEYFQGFPVLDAEAAEWLVSFPLKGIGFDTISADRVDSPDYPVHTILLSNDLIIIENLRNLKMLPARFFTFSGMPLNIEDADGSPVRAVAMVD
jgi:arylformamidase